MEKEWNRGRRGEKTSKRKLGLSQKGRIKTNRNPKATEIQNSELEVLRMQKT